MSLAETYILASRARAKLTTEASRQDHDLRKLVHHANLLDDLLEQIQNHKVESDVPTRSYSAFPKLGNTTVTFIEDFADGDDDDSDSDDDYHYATEISYSDESDEDYEYNTSEDEDEDEDDEDEQVAWEVNLKRVQSNNFRSLPTIDELTEAELEELESEESDEDESEDFTKEETQTNQSTEEEEEETDIVDLKKTPSLNYTSSTEDEDEDDHEDYTTSHSNGDLFNLIKFKEINHSIDNILLGEDITSQT